MASPSMSGSSWWPAPQAARGFGMSPVGPGTSKVRRAFGRLVVLVAVAVAVAQLADLVWALRLYAGGFGSGVSPRWWDPPLPALLLIVAGVLAAAFYGWWIFHLGRAEAVTGAEPAAKPRPLRLRDYSAANGLTADPQGGRSTPKEGIGPEWTRLAPEQRWRGQHLDRGERPKAKAGDRLRACVRPMVTRQRQLDDRLVTELN